MVQQMIDSKFNEYGLGSTESNLPTHDRQLPVAVKKMALRDVQNENRITNSSTKSPLLKSKVQTMDPTNVSGTKRTSPEHPVNPLQFHSPSKDAQLVYVRRKSDAEMAKSSPCDGKVTNAESLNSHQPGHKDVTVPPKPQMQLIQEAKVPRFSAFSPMPHASFISTSGKPSVPPVGQSSKRFPHEESNYKSISSPVIPSNNPKGARVLHWEERYWQLQILLKKLDESDQEEYIQMLRSLSSVELSRHAVELEKRAIQLSLEEATEVQRVAIFNILGKPVKNFKAPSPYQGQSDK